MSGVGTWMGFFSALFTMITAIVGALVTWKVFIPMKRTVEATHQTGEVTHQIVNQEKTDAQAYRDSLIAALRDKGIHVPGEPRKGEPVTFIDTVTNEPVGSIDGLGSTDTGNTVIRSPRMD